MGPMGSSRRSVVAEMANGARRCVRRNTLSERSSQTPKFTQKYVSAALVPVNSILYWKLTGRYGVTLRVKLAAAPPPCSTNTPGEERRKPNRLRPVWLR